MEESLKNKTEKKHIKQKKLNMQIAKLSRAFLFHRHPPVWFCFSSQNSVNQTEKK